jgi:RHS repeat-associated protein
MIKGSDVNYYHKDHLGSSTVMTDASGTMLETTDYMPFGFQRDSSGPNPNVTHYRFTDQELDVESGLYNYNARLYDPVIGRFISADCMVPDPFDPQMFNRYSYCRNNPLIYIDPSGHMIDPGIFDSIGELRDATSEANPNQSATNEGLVDNENIESSGAPTDNDRDDELHAGGKLELLKETFKKGARMLPAGSKAKTLYDINKLDKEIERKGLTKDTAKDAINAVTEATSPIPGFNAFKIEKDSMIDQAINKSVDRNQKIHEMGDEIFDF